MESLKSFNDAFAQLEELEGFDSEAFLSTDKDEQTVCDFILSLALIYNDIKNIDLSASLLITSKPDGEFEIRPDWGEYNGINMFFNRLRISILNELMNNIDRWEMVFNHLIFLRTIKQISKKSRDAWLLLIEAANAAQALPKKNNPYFMIRNKTSFHYDIGQISDGYKHFFEKVKPSMLPMLSRGDQMIASRFYFADAAAEACLHLSLAEKPLKEFFSDLETNLSNLNQALHDIIRSFITIRKPGWKPI